MDMEQRIGRIHRYGQNHTAQVYNLVLSDTIEGRIYLLLDEKLTEIAKTVGKVDDQGNVAEDLRAQILGQLTERLNYDRMYQEALSDPELKRTKVELEAALSNSREAREVVSDLFQDLEGFSLDDYQPFADVSSSLDRLADFLAVAVSHRGQKLVREDSQGFSLVGDDGKRHLHFTTDRDLAAQRDDLELLGLDHPLVQEELERWRSFPPEELGLAVVSEAADGDAYLSVWQVETSTGKGERRTVLAPIAVKPDGTRALAVERKFVELFQARPAPPLLTPVERAEMFQQFVEPALQRELKHRGAANGDGSYAAELIAYIEIAGAEPRQP